MVFNTIDKIKKNVYNNTKYIVYMEDSSYDNKVI